MMFPKIGWITTLIERIGYPIVVSGALFYMIFIGLDKQEKAVDRLTESVQELSKKIDENMQLTKRILRRRANGEVPVVQR